MCAFLSCPCLIAIGVHCETSMGAVQVSRARDDNISRLGSFCIWNLSIDCVLNEIQNIAFHRHDRSLS